MKKKTSILSLILVVLFAVAALTGCNGATPPEAYEGDNVQQVGQGSTTFRLEVTDPSGEVSAWDVSTDAETVGAALLEVGLIDGDESEWGLFVTSVNGNSATDGYWWAFWINGEMAPMGVDSTYIEAGVTYAFVYESL
ncbi:MAG: DUF4430 domain-containing protein [Oscillospiraceae bacterium]|nr:DUF4430 domain-containing protein [Oscillospiraceae bacterium]